QQAQQWLDQGLSVPRISINVSMQQFIQPNFLPQLMQTLTDTGLDPKRLQIEITESLLHQDPGGIASLFTALNKMNIQIAVDDFGTGYSNLSRLQAMPIDCLKIDRLFVRNIEGHKRNQAILSSMIAMAQGLELNVIAEGVETQVQREFLIQKGCYEAQGYLLSLPLDLEQTVDFLRQLQPADTASA
ncbi:MAG: EAL domain-containing protein, partial [Desulfuromonadaceae bacterium]